MRRLARRLLDSGPILVLAAIAGAGSFTHIRDTATEHGQSGWMAWAVAVCVDLTCVMAARERQRDKQTGRVRDGRISWPTLVLVAGIVLSLAANLNQADPSPWGWITAATPAGAFLVAVSMLERRASAPRPEPSPAPSSVLEVAAEPAPVPRPVPAEQDGPSSELLDYARRVAEEYQTAQGKPISRDTLRARLGVSHQLASDLLRHLRTAPEAL
ncbi:DUF2637 domain-containing protein [Streptosporangium roseum]|uniref:DUF2637 domain-containing protein n=1 Tax=Streptosporangium roseum (strain ATCC 12428 / DSM 43021 / JCM 3005 / KCTC 9067 / NCIMB 10171 / NRRL 2505 / NI 9100) TaxID=479432 RepID=D2B473_STRRD|nr:DUF2637 domain-containing protein [Streptosporangium roseum]ACZ91307.1 hypothetical protein Sros_8665 [Streptosporangium roseum DSM 43021]